MSQKGPASPLPPCGAGAAGGAAKWRLPPAASGCDPARRGFAAGLAKGPPPPRRGRCVRPAQATPWVTSAGLLRAVAPPSG